jgi:hypothetical protein
MRRYPKHLGHLVCDECGQERCEADDRDSWLITVDRGYLAETRCPACQAVELELSEHAITRWHERVRPGLTLEAAEEDLVRQLATHACWGPPDWLSEKELGGDRWLMIGDDVAFPVRGNFLASCFVRGIFNPRMRRIVSDVNHFHKRANRAKERPHKRKWEGRQAKRRKQDRRSWREEAS